MPGVESAESEVDCVGSVRHRGAKSVPVAGWRKKLGPRGSVNNGVHTRVGWTAGESSETTASTIACGSASRPGPTLRQASQPESGPMKR